MPKSAEPLSPKQVISRLSGVVPAWQKFLALRDVPEERTDAGIHLPGETVKAAAPMWGTVVAVSKGCAEHIRLGTRVRWLYPQLESEIEVDGIKVVCLCEQDAACFQQE